MPWEAIVNRSLYQALLLAILMLLAIDLLILFGWEVRRSQDELALMGVMFVAVFTAMAITIVHFGMQPPPKSDSQATRQARVTRRQRVRA